MTKSRPAVLAAMLLVLAACSKGDSPSASSPKQDPVVVSHIHGLGVDAQGGLYVATHHGLIKTADESSWAWSGPDRSDHMGFSIEPKTGVLYRSGHSPKRPQLGLESSTDGGASWSHVSDVLTPPADFHSMAVSFGDGAVYGADSGRRGVLRSEDGGKSWSKLPVDPSVYALAGPAAPGTVLAGTPKGMVRSIDAGKTWKPVSSLGVGWVIAIAADPSDAKHILAFTFRGMKVTRDGGATWLPALGGLPPKIEITSLAISAKDSAVAYAADATSVFKTTDDGKTWTQVKTPS